SAAPRAKAGRSSSWRVEGALISAAQGPAELVHPEEKARFDRTPRGLPPGGGLAVRQAPVEGQPHALALLGRERPAGRAHPVPALDALQALGAERAHQARIGAVLRRLFLAAPARLAPPQPVERARARQHEEPAARRRALRLVAAGLAPDLEKGFLEHL